MTISSVETPGILTRPDIQRAEPTLGKVAVLYTTPESVLEDYGRLMELADYRSALLPGVKTLLKVNISWQHFYPACSSAPWQIEGVVNELRRGGYEDLVAAHNGTVVVDPVEGRVRNKHAAVEDRLGVPHVILDSPPIKWKRYRPTARMLVLDDIYKDGLYVPEVLPETNIVQLPTVKTHVFTTMTGALKNAFGGLLHRYRHWTHSVIHETLVDLLQIQREIHSGLFAVMDGTFAGDGPGPRAMRIHTKNVILASADQVAIDSVAASMMGFDPMSLPDDSHRPRERPGRWKPLRDRGRRRRRGWRRLAVFGERKHVCQPRAAHDLPRPAEAVGEPAAQITLVPWAFWASNVYHNDFWLRFIGRKRVRAAMNTPWGRLFQQY